MYVIHAVDELGQPVDVWLAAAGQVTDQVRDMIADLGWTIAVDTPVRLVTLPELAAAKPANPAYRWRGVDPRGEAAAGRAAWPDLATEVRRRFNAGWKTLVVCTGDGPVPPPAIGPAGVVAEIGRHPGTGQRSWWAGYEDWAAS